MEEKDNSKKKDNSKTQYCYNGKQISTLLRVNSGLERMINGPIDRLLKFVFAPPKYLKMAKQFLNIPEIKEMYDKIEAILESQKTGKYKK